MTPYNRMMDAVPVADGLGTVSYTADDLNAMTIAEIKALAADRGYTVTQTKKADIIAQFLGQQEG